MVCAAAPAKVTGTDTVAGLASVPLGLNVSVCVARMFRLPAVPPVSPASTPTFIDQVFAPVFVKKRCAWCPAPRES